MKNCTPALDRHCALTHNPGHSLRAERSKGPPPAGFSSRRSQRSWGGRAGRSAGASSGPTGRETPGRLVVPGEPTATSGHLASFVRHAGLAPHNCPAHLRARPGIGRGGTPGGRHDRQVEGRDRRPRPQEGGRASRGRAQEPRRRALARRPARLRGLERRLRRAVERDRPPDARGDRPDRGARRRPRSRALRRRHARLRHLRRAQRAPHDRRPQRRGGRGRDRDAAAPRRRRAVPRRRPRLRRSAARASSPSSTSSRCARSSPCGSAAGRSSSRCIRAARPCS